MLPYENNSLSNYLAAREPLYRQNVYQFFSGMNDVYRAQVKAGGNVPEAMKEEDFVKRDVTDEALQLYLREARRSVDIKIFKVQIKHTKEI